MNIKFNLTKKDKLLIFSIAFVLLFISLVGWSLIGDGIYNVIIILAFLIVLILQLHSYRQLTLLQKEKSKEYLLHSKRDFLQFEALTSLYFSLNNSSPPLPDTRGWAASPDFLKTMATLIYEVKPSIIVEAGSGVSTLVGGYCLKNIGSGKIVSLDHLEKYAEQTQEQLKVHKLEDICNIIFAPIVDYQIEGESWKWYDLTNFKKTLLIDFLIVDGPPSNLQKMSRYPALPLLFEKLKKDSIILMDDGDRKDEEAIVKKWITKYPNFTVEYKSLEKGCYILRMK